MPADLLPVTSQDDDDDDQSERNRRLLLVLGVLGLVSAVIAGIVIFSSGESKPPKDPVAAVHASAESLVVGRTSARVKVAVYEDFGSAPSREFETASRDFLVVEAAQDNVQVQYHPLRLTGGYSEQALEAWAAVLEHGTPKQAMAYRDRLFDRQPEGGVAPTADDLEAWAVDVGVAKGVVTKGLSDPDHEFVEAARSAAREAGVAVAPTVVIDGKWLDPASGTALADELQRRILEEAR